MFALSNVERGLYAGLSLNVHIHCMVHSLKTTAYNRALKEQDYTNVLKGLSKVFLYSFVDVFVVLRLQQCSGSHSLQNILLSTKPAGACTKLQAFSFSHLFAPVCRLQTARRRQTTSTCCGARSTANSASRSLLCRPRICCAAQSQASGNSTRSPTTRHVHVLTVTSCLLCRVTFVM